MNGAYLVSKLCLGTQYLDAVRRELESTLATQSVAVLRYDAERPNE